METVRSKQPTTPSAVANELFDVYDMKMNVGGTIPPIPLPFSVESLHPHHNQQTLTNLFYPY